jgi:hypothetical protein
LEWYVIWVKSNPLLSAAIQFAILGTLGEFISHLMKQKTGKGFGTLLQISGKVLAWALLGIIIKYGFAGMKGFVNNLVDHGMFPAVFKEGLGYAIAVSVTTNVFFGPQMMAFHRLEDNLILRRWNFDGIQKSWLTLIWFWIPAHTVTFVLPGPYQIGLAAIWSVALGIILGLNSGAKSSS